MAFWGIEVKPGKPFTHSFDRVRGRLRISQATLGIGSSEKKSLVQCNVGDKSPVFLCALLPDRTESCHLDLEFEEADDVVFSVIGPRSVYLTGYYVCNNRHSNLNDDTDSYGEDIANTETDESTHRSDEDEYDDSFIDDGNVEVFPPSPVSSGGVSVDEKLDNKKPKEKKGNHKRLKKRNFAIESDDEHGTQPENIVNGCKVASGLESEDEDNFLISSFYNRATEARDKVDGEMGKTGNKKKEDDDVNIIKLKSKASDVAIDDEPGRGLDLPCNALLPSAGVDPENGLEVNKEREKMSSEGKILKADNANYCDILKEDRLLPTEEKTDGISQDLLVKNGQCQKPATDNGSGAPYHSLLPSDELGLEEQTKSKKKRKERRKEGKAVEVNSVNNGSFLKDSEAVEDKADDQKPATHKGTDQSYDSLLPSTTEAGSENGPKPKKRRKELAAEGRSAEDSANNSNICKEDKVKQNKEVAGKSSKDLSARNEQDLKFLYDKIVDDNSNRIVDGDQSVDKKGKKKKKSKIQENGGIKDIDLPPLSKRPVMGFEDRNMETEPSQARTLSNGLIIQELETGKTDGKIAALGKKVKVHYIGKLRDNGQIFDSNIGKAPLKFRLGAQDVIEGWNIGLDGMRVGGKRRLIVPPSMGYGSQGTGENIPPNSWLIYEVELAGIR